MVQKETEPEGETVPSVSSNPWSKASLSETEA